MKQILMALTVIVAALHVGCKKDDTTVPKQKVVMETIAIGKAEGFSVLAGASVTSTGDTDITGDLGLSPGTAVDGFPPGILDGTLRVNDNLSTGAKLDLTAAYNDAAGRTSKDIVSLSGNIGGMTLTPGLYKSTSSLEISSGDVTFDAKGDDDAVFIIQIASSLTTTPGRKVILKGGAQASNIFWQVSSSASFGTTTVFYGTIMALESITFDTGASLNGRALARNGSITLDNNRIVNE